MEQAGGGFRHAPQALGIIGGDKPFVVGIVRIRQCANRWAAYQKKTNGDREGRESAKVRREGRRAAAESTNLSPV